MFLRDKDLFKDVKKVELSELLPNHKFPPGFDHAIVDSDNNILNFCSGRYNLVPNSVILHPLEAYFKINKIDFIRRGKVINGSKFYVEYIIKMRKDFGEITGMLPKICVWNSYDGVSGGRLELGFHRLVASSTLSRPENSGGRYFKHAAPKTNDTDIHDKVIRIIAESKEFMDNCDKDIKKYVELTKIKANRRTVSIVGKKLGFSKKIIQAAEERYDLEVVSGIEYLNEHNEKVIHSGCEKNMFTVYNALNYGIYNTNLKELPDKKVEKDKKLINFILSSSYFIS